MGYFIRVFGKKDPDIPLSIINNKLNESGLQVSISVETGTDKSWELINISGEAGNDIVQIERNSTYGDSLGRDELIEFTEEIENCKPRTAVEWLKNFFQAVEVIYAFQVFDFSEHTKGWEVIGEIKNLLLSITKGISQADLEGFSNEEGYHILWQFSDSVEGDWHMAVLSPSNEWIKFKMDLGNKAHRATFMDGRVPKGIKPVNT
jgi:hypothetical protein